MPSSWLRNEAIRGDREAFVNENADLLYNVVALWTEVGIAPQEIWTEMDRGEALLRLAEVDARPGEDISD
jgi:phosphoribosyl-ATP pyrophosphohydrolase